MLTRTGLTPATLHWEWAHPRDSCIGTTGRTPCHICTSTGLQGGEISKWHLGRTSSYASLEPDLIVEVKREETEATLFMADGVADVVADAHFSAPTPPPVNAPPKNYHEIVMAQLSDPDRRCPLPLTPLTHTQARAHAPREQRLH